MEHFIDDPLDVVNCKPDFSNIGLQSVSLDSKSMEEIYVLFICEVQEDVLSLTCAHSYYSTREKAIEAKQFFNKIHCNPNLVYQVFKFPVQ